MIRVTLTVCGFFIAAALAPASQITGVALQELNLKERFQSLDRGSASGEISGTVVSVGGGQLLDAARVSLSGQSGAKSITTDESGSFKFVSLSAGLYNLSATRTHYLQAAYGQRQPLRPGTPIQLADGAKISDVAIQMYRGGAVNGTIEDRSRAEPIEGVLVRAMRYTWRTGSRRPVELASGTTDDRGVFRLHDLPPGEYVICGAKTSGVDSFASEPSDGRKVYATTCYPGATAIREATSINVGSGDDRHGLDFEMVRVPVGSISGIVTGSEGLPSFLLHLVSDQPIGLRLPSAKVSSGSFAFQGLPAGHYTNEARIMTTEPAAASGQGGKPLQLWADTPVDVGGSPVAGVTVALRRACSIQGHVLDAEVGAVVPFSLRVPLVATLTPVGDTQLDDRPNNLVTMVGSDHSFNITNVVPGSYVLSISGGGNSTKSAIINGRDAFDSPFEITCGQEVYSAVVTLSRTTTTLTGVVRNVALKGMPGVTVVAFAQDDRLWVPRSRHIQATVSSTSGTFGFRDLPAGAYRLVALLDVETGRWFDPKFLASLSSVGVDVLLNEGETKSQDLIGPRK